MKQHKERIKNARPVIKIDTPRDRKPSSRAESPQKGKGDRQDEIAKSNMILARRIFDIMVGPGIISNLLESSMAEHHPGTINFSHRLAEAKRIHQENMVLASRLDSVKAYYDTTSVRVLASAKNNRKKKPRGLPMSKKSRHVDPVASGRVVLGKNALKVTPDFNGEIRSEGQSKRPRNVLLEYTKIQKGCVLDVAVIKEPFRDSYSIFGIDIDSGQRYELRLTSEEVSSILEGDLLVTSVDNIEVWMALLNKIELRPVEAFAKLPLPPVNSKSDQSVPISRPVHEKDKGQGPSPNNPSEGQTQAGPEESSAVATNRVDDDMESLTDVSTQRQKADSMCHAEGYTLDDYYDDHAPLSPLPSQELGEDTATGGDADAQSGGLYGELLDTTFFDRMSVSGTSGERPAAKSGTGRAVSCMSGNGDSAKGFDRAEAADDEIIAATRDVATISTIYYLETATNNILMQTCGKRAPAAKRGHAGKPPQASAQRKETVSFQEPTREVPKEPKPQNRHSIIAPKPPNPYTSTRITAAPRSKSFRYTQVPKGMQALETTNQQSISGQVEELPKKGGPPAAVAPRRSVLRKSSDTADKNPHPPHASQPSRKPPPHRQSKGGALKQIAEKSVVVTRTLVEQITAEYIEAALMKVDGLVLLTRIDESVTTDGIAYA